jgi:hypothetical protein
MCMVHECITINNVYVNKFKALQIYKIESQLRNPKRKNSNKPKHRNQSYSRNQL